MSEKQTTEGNNDVMHKSWGTLVGLGLSYTESTLIGPRDFLRPTKGAFTLDAKLVLNKI
jgi:hypothetical protein